MLRVFVCSFMTYRAIQQSITDTFLDDVGQGDLLGIILDKSGINKCSFHSQCHVLAFFVCVCLLISQFTTAPKGSAEVLANVLTCKKAKGSLAFAGRTSLGISSKANLPVSKSSACFAWKVFVFLLFWTVLLDKRLLVNSYFLLYRWDNVSFCSQGWPKIHHVA